ncbi:unnamed protein product [Rotaria sordida]|uniref:Uncharacterized protein n=1 Tax=Rotaria sordida TaxID=392033 RepID=A0A815LIH3_9BILA|nr:unnamed protein product [Rotaria sordida]
MRMAILCAAVPAAGGIDGILTYGISHMQGIGGLKSWQWTFLLEGLPIIPLGVLVYVLLDKIPNAVQWLSNIEKQLLTNLLRDDAGVADSEPIPETRISWRQIYRDVDKPTYRRGHAICGGLIAVSIVATIILWVCLMKENNRRTNLSPEEYTREATIKEPCDRHPDVRYSL